LKIGFDKVGHSAKRFQERVDRVSLEGTLQKESHHRIALIATLTGPIEVQCSRCGREFEQFLDLPLALTLSDQMAETKDDLDIIEFLDGIVDMTYILQSELNAIKSEYHQCSECQRDEEAFEMEF